MSLNLLFGTTASKWRRPLITGLALCAGFFMALSAQAQTLQLWMPFDDSGPGTTTTSDPSGALGAGVTLLMETSAGVATNLHGASSSGVQNQGRSIDFSSNPFSGNAAANIAYVTNNAALGSLGVVSNFTVTVWVKLTSAPTNTANQGPRIFLMGTNGVNDSGQANSIALHFNTQAGALSNSIVGRVNGSQPSLPIYFPYPAGLWQFFALVYDAGTSNAMIYYGTEGSPAKLLCVNNVGAQVVDFGSSGTLQIGNRITGPRNRGVKGSIDDFRFYTGAANAAFVESIRQTSTPVVVSGLYPDGMSLMQGTNTLSFTASSGNGITPSNIKVAVNGSDVSSGLTIGGSSTSRTVSYANLTVDPTLINNANLNAARIDIQVTDDIGIIASNRIVYDAFSPTHFTWDAEDYDFGSGLYIDNPRYAFENTIGTTEDTYYQRAGTPPVDYNDNGNGAPRVYRDPLELVATEFSLGGAVNGGVNIGELMRQKVLNALALDSSVREVNVGFFDGGAPASGIPNWMNYTRTYPSGLFNVYARVAFGGGAGSSALNQVTSGWGTPVQTVTNLGSFTLNNSGGWQSYQWVPLRNTNGNLVQLNLGGTNTLQSIAGGGGGGNENFFMLVPANTNLPIILGVFPNGALQPSPTFSFTVNSPTGVAINTNSISVLLTGVPLAGNSFVSNLTALNGLVITGPTTNRSVVYPGLQTNVSYTAVISVTDVNGSPAGQTVNFNTYNPILTWEAEDYNYSSGLFIDNPQTNQYAGVFGTADVDYHEGAGAGGRGYRDIGVTTGPATETATDTPRLAYGTGLIDYNVGFYDGGDWLNYTRTMPAGQYNIYLRAANGGGGNGGLTLSQVTSDPTLPGQTTTNLGSFTIPPTGGWQTYTFVPLRDAGGNLVKFTGGSVQTLRGTSSGGLNANFYALFAANTNLPTINNLYPNGASFFQFTNQLTFVASSPAGISTANIVVTLNGVNISGSLVFGGTPANRTVSYTGLLANTNHTVSISVTDTNGNTGTTTVNFDTFKSTYFTWEMEDYDYSSGLFFDNPQVGAYSGLSATADVDYHENNTGGAFIYRPNGTATEVTADLGRAQFAPGTDYNIGFFGQSEWGNYTRHYPAGTYNVWGRFACGTADQSQAFLSVVTDGWGTTTQTTNFFGTFSIPFTSWTSFGWVPLRDGSGNLTTISLNGSTNTLKLTRNPTAPFGDANVNFLMLVPTAAPITIEAALSGTNIVVSFQTQSGLTYQIEFKNDLLLPTWTPLGSPVPGDGSIKSVNDPVSTTKRFYRARIQ